MRVRVRVRVRVSAVRVRMRVRVSAVTGYVEPRAAMAHHVQSAG